MTTEKETKLQTKETTIRSLGYTSLGLAIGYAGNLTGVNWFLLLTGIGAGLAMLGLMNLIGFFLKKKVSWEDFFNLLALLGGILPAVTRNTAWSAIWAAVFVVFGVAFVSASLLPLIREKERLLPSTH